MMTVACSEIARLALSSVSEFPVYLSCSVSAVADF